MPFADSHVHLSDCRDPVQVVGLARSTETVLIANGTDRRTSEATLILAATSPSTVVPFVGVHPSNAQSEGLEWLEAALARAKGVGEVGLDPKYSLVGRGGRQLDAFERQLAAAEGAGFPVEVHSRGAERECLDVLSSYTIPTVLMHWFEGGPLLPEVMSRGYFVSFGPALVYSKKLQRMAREVLRDLALTESDGPVSYAPLGGANGSALIPSVVFRLAELWGLDFASARDLISSNSRRFLGEHRKG